MKTNHLIVDHCRGCSAQLQPLKAVSAFGQDFNVELGASPEWIFKAGRSEGLAAGPATTLNVSSHAHQGAGCSTEDSRRSTLEPYAMYIAQSLPPCISGWACRSPRQQRRRGQGLVHAHLREKHPPPTHMTVILCSHMQMCW